MSNDKESLAAWMIQNGFSTGHGDTVGDLLGELLWQIKELNKKYASELTHLKLQLQENEQNNATSLRRAAIEIEEWSETVERLKVAHQIAERVLEAELADKTEMLENQFKANDIALAEIDRLRTALFEEKAEATADIGIGKRW